MDSIQFSIIPSLLEDYLTTNIYINGIDLRAIIAKIEYDDLKRFGVESISGAYEGISPFLAFHLHNHFYGETSNEYLYYDFRYTLFDYMYSGVPGDYTLTCRITINNDRVIWHDFKNFSKIYKGAIDYGGLSFSFPIEKYKAAIYDIKNNEIKKMYV